MHSCKTGDHEDCLEFLDKDFCVERMVKDHIYGVVYETLF